MRKIDLKSLGVSQDEVEAALARERRPGVRRRLVAVCKILEGKSIKQAARAAKATRRSVERWLRQVRQFGFQSLLTDGRHGHARRSMKPNQVSETRRQIATALAGPLKPQVRARLIAIDRVLSGRPIDEVAASARVLPNAVKSWLRTVTYGGIAPTLARWEGQGKPRPRQVDADPVALRELAAKETNPRIRKRVLALACVAEGMGVYDAEVKVGLNRSAITKRVRRFREEGIAAFQDRKIGGRPRKLSAAQFQELRIEFLGRPGMQLQQLRDLIWTRFRVRYSLTNLRRLLKKEFAIASASRQP
jgi:transposase